MATQWRDYFKGSYTAPHECNPGFVWRLLLRGEKLDRRANEDDCVEGVTKHNKLND